MPPPPGINDPALIEALRAGDGDDELSVIVRLSDPDALPAGIRILTRFGDIATVRVERARLQELADSATVTALEASRNLRPSDESEEGFVEGDAADDSGDSPEPWLYTRRPEGLQGTGKGCVVAALDWGLDHGHPAFQHADGTTRIISLWDQRGTEGGGPGNRWGYGHIYTSEEINRALQGEDPYKALNYHPADAGGKGGAHGTHVMDIAAGSGLGGGMPGVAPEADLVFVHLARTTDVLGEGNLGDSASVLEALDHVFTVAGERPCVINMSVGAHGGPHDGSTLVELGIDQAVSLAPGRAVTNSAGNYRTKRAHSAGRVTPEEPKLIPFRVPPHDTNDSEVELFYGHIDRFTVEVLAPSGSVLARVTPGQDLPLIVAGTKVGHIHHQIRHRINGDHHVDVIIRPEAPAGVWAVRLIGETVHDGRYHAWIERDKGLQPVFLDRDIVTSSTTGTLCNGRLSVTCGCGDPHKEQPTLASFSSGGPTRDGRAKPEVVAAGVRIRAARSTPRGEPPGARYVRKSGTSMSAPHVAGIIALMFEAAGKPLEIYDTRALLFGSVDPSPFFDRAIPGPDLHRFGYGYLDMVAAERSARDFGREKDSGGETTEEARTAWDVDEPTDDDDMVPEPARARMEAAPAEDDYGEEIVPYEEDSTADWLPTSGGDMPEPISRSTVLRNDLGNTRWIQDPGELPSLVFQSLGLASGQALLPVSNSAGLLLGPVEPGDLLVRSVPATGIRYLAVVISDQPESCIGLLGRGVPVESPGPGWFVQVIEVPTGGGEPQTIGRRLTDRWGRVPHYQTVLRPETRSQDGTNGSPVTVDSTSDLGEEIHLADVRVEMQALHCRFLVDHTAQTSDGTKHRFSAGSVASIQDWHDSDPNATVDGFPVPKLVIDPAPDTVATVRQYTVRLAAERAAVRKAEAALDDWVATKASYVKNPSYWEAGKKQLEQVFKDKAEVYSDLWVRHMMYNRFDKTIDHWTEYYNTQRKPPTDLDPNVVKSMAFEEGRLGTSGPNFMPPPWDWSSELHHPVRSRFNIIQAVDSAGAQQWLMMKEMAPSIFKSHGLDKLEASNKWWDRKEHEYWADAEFVAAVKEFFAQRTGGKNLMGTAGKDLHEDYDFWIRAAVRWLFEKFAHLKNPTWREAVRAYNGDGPRARAYRDRVLKRVGGMDPLDVHEEQDEGDEATLAEWPDLPKAPALDRSAVLEWVDLTRVTEPGGARQVVYVVTGAPVAKAAVGDAAKAILHLRVRNTNSVYNHQDVVTKQRLLRADSQGRFREVFPWIRSLGEDLEDESSRTIRLAVTSEHLLQAYYLESAPAWEPDSFAARYEVEYHWREAGETRQRHYNRTGLDFMLVAPIEFLMDQRKRVTQRDIPMNDPAKHRDDYWIRLGGVEFTPELTEPVSWQIQISSTVHRDAGQEESKTAGKSTSKTHSHTSSNTFSAQISGELSAGGNGKATIEVLELGLQAMMKVGTTLGYSHTTTDTTSGTVVREFSQSLKLSRSYGVASALTVTKSGKIDPPKVEPPRRGGKAPAAASKIVRLYAYPMIAFFEVPYVRYTDIDRLGQATRRTEGTVTLPMVTDWIVKAGPD